MELPITVEQAAYLNTVARVARLYRLACSRIQSDLTDNTERLAKGIIPVGIRPNDATDMATSAAQLDILEAMLFTIFSVSDVQTVRVHFRTALNLADHDYIIVTQETK